MPGLFPSPLRCNVAELDLGLQLERVEVVLPWLLLVLELDVEELLAIRTRWPKQLGWRQPGKRPSDTNAR